VRVRVVIGWDSGRFLIAGKHNPTLRSSVVDMDPHCRLVHHIVLEQHIRRRTSDLQHIEAFVKATC
jgi:hypothetical protein